jgi:hypothetical protein
MQEGFELRRLEAAIAAGEGGDVRPICIIDPLDRDSQVSQRRTGGIEEPSDRDDAQFLADLQQQAALVRRRHAECQLLRRGAYGWILRLDAQGPQTVAVQVGQYRGAEP